MIWIFRRFNCIRYSFSNEACYTYEYNNDEPRIFVECLRNFLPKQSKAKDNNPRRNQPYRDVNVSVRQVLRLIYQLIYCVIES